MPPATLARASALALAVALLSCDQSHPTGPAELSGGTTAGAPRAADVAAPSVVISQVYGGGGNSGATYTNDFIELLNTGTQPVSLSGWSVQYASATGTGNFGSPTALSGTLEPGAYYLIQESQGSGGTVALPAPDATGSIAMSASAGKVVLLQSSTALACNGGSTPCTAEQLALIVDLVGYGTANFYEGTGAAPGLSNTTAALRNGDGCQDTNDNAADFAAGAPAPRNTASPTHACVTAPRVVVSQVYGGGGNSGATLKNDFIELLNAGAQAVALEGWSVQYASASGSFTQATALTGTIQPGAYLLVQEAAGSGGTLDLPAPDVTGTIAMSATSAKVILAQSATALGCGASTAPCSADQLALIADLVGYGSPNLYEGTAAAPTLSNAAAALRKGSGCQDTDDNAADFESGAPAPRNSASPMHQCGTGPVGPPATVTILPDTGRVALGGTLAFAAIARDANGNYVATTFTWATGDAAIATVDAAGVVTPVALGTTSLVATTPNDVADTATVVVTQPEIHWMDVSSSTTSFPPGFQTQLFATARTASGGQIIPATFTFEALDPDIATVTEVDNTGIVTGVAASATRPRIKVTATPESGGAPYSFTTSSITIETPISAPTSIYGANDEFGDPTAASSSDPNDLLIVRPQYTLSYNESRGTPNWVSYELDQRQFGSEDRCNCFTGDPLLPADKRIYTSDYTNGGYDRGHMTMSADRTAANMDNAATFYLTNVVPQMADLNQGPWEEFEIALNDSAEAGRAVYVIDGPLYSRSHGLTFLKNEGKVAVPDSTWKVAFIGPVGGGLPFGRGDIQQWTDLAGVTVLAVSMPNVSGIKSVDWTSYLSTVDKIEAATGYDILSLLQESFQTALEAGDHAPTAAFGFTGTADEGSALAFDASASTDPDLGRTDMGRTEALTYAWTFGDGTVAAGVAPAKTYPQDGAYTVTLTATDAWGWPSTVSHTVDVANVAPQVAALGGADLLTGETYETAGGFTDPGADTWAATVDYGDGSGGTSLPLSGKTFQLSHDYGAAGTFSVAVSVSDGEASGGATATVTVRTPLQGITVLTDGVAQLDVSSGPFGGAGGLNALKVTLRAATAACARGNNRACAALVAAFVVELRALVRVGHVDAAAAAPLLAYAARVIESLGG